MVSYTIIYSIIMLIIAISTKRGVGVGILILSILLWPEYLRFPFFGIKMSAPRVIALAFFLKYYLGENKQKRKFHEIDRLIIFGFLWDIFANFVSGASEDVLKRIIGRGLDTCLIYFSVRYAIKDKKDLRDLINPLLLCGVIMGCFGIYEAVTYYSPYQKLMQYHEWKWYQKDLDFRLDFLRAQASTAHSIYYGMSMYFVLGLLISLRGLRNRQKLLLNLGMLASLLGVLSSLSSGPIISVAVLLGINVLYYKQSLIKPVLRLLVIALIAIEILSNRHFYNMVDYIALNSSTAWYRTKLLEVAFSQWHEYWLFGFHGNQPHHWGALVDGRKHVDLVNNYIASAVVGGFPAAIILLRIQYLVLKKAMVIWQRNEEDLRKYAFGIGSLVISFMVGSMSVGIYASALILSYIFYASISWVDNV